MQTTITDYSNPRSLGSRLRAKRLEPLRQLIADAFEWKGKVNILDVGGRKMYWNALGESYLQKYRVSVTILNLPAELENQDDSIFTHVAGDACNMPQYQNDSFDIVHSNSVIEHVGDWRNVKRFANEVRRVAPNIFVQTPYFWFPIEPHFIKPFHHWFPRPWRIRMFLSFQMGQRGRAKDLDEAVQKIEEEPFLMDVGMFRHLFPDCELIRERFFLLTKSMIAVRNRCPISRSEATPISHYREPSSR